MLRPSWGNILELGLDTNAGVMLAMIGRKDNITIESSFQEQINNLHCFTEKLWLLLIVYVFQRTFTVQPSYNVHAI